MKITFIGSSHGMPMKGRFCQCMLVEVGEKAYMIDCGAMSVHWMVNHDFDKSKLKAVFITHLHGDHVNGLTELCDLATWCYNKIMDFDVYLPEKRGVDAFDTMLKCVLGDSGIYPSDRIRLKTIEKPEVYQDDTVKITAYPTLHMQHGKYPAYGYLIEGEGKKLYISGDLVGQDIDDYPEIADTTELDCFVVECAHFPFASLQKRLDNTKAKKVLITHVHPQSQFDAINEYIKIAKTEVIAVNDNDCIEI